MINLRQLEISKHYQRDNKFREKIINQIVNNNWGQIIKFEWHKGTYRCLTDMGLIFILTPEQDKIMTYYLARARVAQGMYKGNAPKFILKRIHKNASKYEKICGVNLLDSKTHELYVKGVLYEE